MTVKRDPEEQFVELQQAATPIWQDFLPDIPTQEDSESSSPGAAAPELSYATRAAEWAEDIRSRPLTDPQAIELAKVYALLAIERQLSRLGTRLGTPSELITAPAPTPKKDS